MLTTGLFRRKSLDQLVGETTDPRHQLRRTLGPFQLTMLGVGAIVGAGIFSTPGTAAAGGAGHIGAGPALVISFLIVSVACGFAALCYSEFAAMVPVSGSAYTYAYATMGELVAWLDRLGPDPRIRHQQRRRGGLLVGLLPGLLDGLHVHCPPGWEPIFAPRSRPPARSPAAQAAHTDTGHPGSPTCSTTPWLGRPRPTVWLCPLFSTCPPLSSWCSSLGSCSSASVRRPTSTRRW